MYNILHLASGRGMRDAMRRTPPRHPHPVAQPAGASHLTLIVGEADAPGAGRPRRAATRPSPTRPSPRGT